MQSRSDGSHFTQDLDEETSIALSMLGAHSLAPTVLAEYPEPILFMPLELPSKV